MQLRYLFGIELPGFRYDRLRELAVLRPEGARVLIVDLEEAALERAKGPTALLLSRQNLAFMKKEKLEEVARGGYVLADAVSPKAVIMTISMDSSWRLTSLRSSRPLISGMRMSVMTASNISPRTASTASVPLEAHLTE